jgi:hypothetical protein
MHAATEEYNALAADPVAAATDRLKAKAAGLSAVSEDKDFNEALTPPVGTGKAALMAKVHKALKNPEALMLTMIGWGHRLAVLLLPLMTLILGMLYFYRKRFYLFDHFLVACNLMSFVFLTNALVLALPENIRAWVSAC